VLWSEAMFGCSLHVQYDMSNVQLLTETLLQTGDHSKGFLIIPAEQIAGFEGNMNILFSQLSCVLIFFVSGLRFPSPTMKTMKDVYLFSDFFDIDTADLA